VLSQGFYQRQKRLQRSALSELPQERLYVHCRLSGQLEVTVAESNRSHSRVLKRAYERFPL
jgi:hypothetical protein